MIKRRLMRLIIILLCLNIAFLELPLNFTFSINGDGIIVEDADSVISENIIYPADLADVAKNVNSRVIAEYGDSILEYEFKAADVPDIETRIIVEYADSVSNYELICPVSPDQPPTCHIKLLKSGVEINEIDVGEFFDIYVGDSVDDLGIETVRFSSDDYPDGVPTGEWTEWYDWNTSVGDWNASNKSKKWMFATYGLKEVWVEIKDTSRNVCRVSTNIFAGWTFAVITDLHIGRGYSDYGGKGTNDAGSEGQNYYLTKRLEEVVKWLNQNYTKWNIKFLVVLGDVSDSGEYSEIAKAKEILDNLEIPYFPVIGNHDVWSKVKGAEEKPIGDRYFQNVFNNTFLNIQLQKLGVEWNYTYNFILSPYYNYAFDYRGKTFLFLDFVNRKESLGGIYNAKGVLNTDTMMWLENWLKHASSEGKPVIIFTHHPMVDPEKRFLPIWQYVSMEVSCFSDEDLRILENLFYSTNADIKANFAGHVHGFFDPEKSFWPEKWNPIFLDANVNYKNFGYTPANIDVITTEAFMVGSNVPEHEGIVRIVRVEGKEISSTMDGKFPALNPYFKPKLPMFINEADVLQYYFYYLMTGKVRIDFEVYAFTKRYSAEHPLAYNLSYGDGEAEIKHSSEEELVKFAHYYNIKTEKTYNVTLTVLGYTSEGERIIEKISRKITLPKPLFIIAESPVDLIVTDPNNLTISKQINDIGGAIYIEQDINQDGHLDDLIYIPDRKIGDYQIVVVPEFDAKPTDTYTLYVLADNTTLILAENVQIKKIPDQPYIVRSTETEVIPEFPSSVVLFGFLTLMTISLVLIKKKCRRKAKP